MRDHARVRRHALGQRAGLAADAGGERVNFLAGRKAEIENINGAIPREGGKLGVATPVNSTLVAALRAKESGFKSS